jgi:enoyl-CoA hydratase/carnithine racemase
MSEYQTILTEVSDKVATIWLNRPERRNSFSADMTRELHAAFAAFEADDGVRAVVVTGAGKYFSAGADLGRRGGDTFSRSAGADTSEQQERPPRRPGYDLCDLRGLIPWKRYFTGGSRPSSCARRAA